MKITRVNLSDKFSTFLLVSDSSQNIFVWRQDLKLKLNIDKIISPTINNSETIAYNFLNLVREKNQQIFKNHLSSYLQESCYWAAKQVYLQKQNTLNLLTLEECFSSGNEATIHPEKILNKYQINAGSKITTYAQTRLKTIISDAIYKSRQRKLLTNWGLLKKSSKKQIKQVLTEIAGLSNQTIQELVLVWQCYVDNAVASIQGKNNRLSTPNDAQLRLMTSQYNLWAKKSNFNHLTIDEFKDKLEFCGEQVRIFHNLQTISYEDKVQNLDLQIEEQYLVNQEKSQLETQLNNLIITSFHELNNNFKTMIYFYWGLGLTQQEIIQIMQLNYPDFISQQYQFSRKITSIKKTLLDNLMTQLKQELNINKSQDKTELTKLIQQWLEEYIESDILLLCEQCYQKLDRNQQELLKTNYYRQSKKENQIILEELNGLFKKAIAAKLTIKIPENKNITNSLNLLIEKFCHQHFNRIMN
jgi:RNA polymerase sigma factor (sigma-70 family)